MFVRHALRRLLPLLAVLSVALAPVAVPAATAHLHASIVMHAHAVPMTDTDMTDAHDMAGMAMDAMPCCPEGQSGMPDCAKACPMMALCVAKVAAGMPVATGLPVRVAVAQVAFWEGEALFASLAQAPPSEPPRS